MGYPFDKDKGLFISVNDEMTIKMKTEGIKIFFGLEIPPTMN